MGKIIRFLTQRVVLVAAAILLQLLVLAVAIFRFSEHFIYFYIFNVVISLLVVVLLVNNRSNPSFKIAWIIVVLLFPVFGGLFYLMFGNDHMSRREGKRIAGVQERLHRVMPQSHPALEELLAADRRAGMQAVYLEEHSGFPLCKNTYTEYLPSGEVKFQRLLEELEKAEHYIFLEYFILQEGKMWNSVLDILVRKVQQGVQVRVIYDDMGCILTLPHRYDKYLESLGIRCCVFNPLVPLLSIRMNNRDHRKIVVIDGHTGFTGGINLADEYINEYPKHGHWKDTAVLLKGEAVWNLTVMFLSLWDSLRKEEEDYEIFRPSVHQQEKIEGSGYVLPYGDSPLDMETVGESVYLNIINKAQRYVYITTPYLILDNEMITALCLAAKDGVDVRIITPHIPDKWYVHAVSRAYYGVLQDSGVKIYEYTPGFIHAKTFVSDDEVAVVGTINLDFRSLYLHFECAAWMYRTGAVPAVRDDFIKTMNESQLVAEGQYQKMSLLGRLGRAVLRCFAPLM